MRGNDVAGYDLAAIWLNLVKILIGLLFVYQQVVGDQLSMNMFGGGKSFYVFYRQLLTETAETDTDSLAFTAGNGGPSVQQVTFENPQFFISYLPLTLMNRYHHGEIAVERIEGPSGSIDINGSASKKRFSWPERGNNALQLVSFNFMELLKPIEPTAGTYSIHFGVHLYDSAKDLIPSESWPNDPGQVNEVRVGYQEPPELVKRHFGPLPIVEGRGCDFPYQLRGKSITATALRRRSEESETRGEQQDAGSWESVEQDRIKIIPEDNRFEGTRLRHDSSSGRKNHYMLEASYTEPGVEGAEPEVYHIEVSFLVQDNLSPRPIYESGDSPGRVAILYPKHRYQEKTQQGISEYFILDSFIVDPDGVSSLRPRRLVIDGAEGNYSIGREEQTGMFLLQIKEPRLVAPRPSPTQPNVMEETIALIASDEVNSSRIEVSIQKQATLEW